MRANLAQASERVSSVATESYYAVLIGLLLTLTSALGECDSSDGLGCFHVTNAPSQSCIHSAPLLNPSSAHNSSSHPLAQARASSGCSPAQRAPIPAAAADHATSPKPAICWTLASSAPRASRWRRKRCCKGPRALWRRQRAWRPQLWRSRALKRGRALGLPGSARPPPRSRCRLWSALAAASRGGGGWLASRDTSEDGSAM